jgi:hypothetical protein
MLMTIAPSSQANLGLQQVLELLIDALPKTKKKSKPKPSKTKINGNVGIPEWAGFWEDMANDIVTAPRDRAICIECRSGCTKVSTAIRCQKCDKWVHNGFGGFNFCATDHFKSCISLP